MGGKPLELRFLGEMSVTRAGQRLALPPSKKTRALLAYLAVTGRPHRRERLCDLLWDVPDDPRGALRWSLSKLRALVDEPDRRRIIADRETVAFDCGDAVLDVVTVRQGLEDPSSIPTEALAAQAAAFHGPFLEGLELPDCHDFQAWRLAGREDLRALHLSLLRVLIERLADTPEKALPHARTLVQADSFDESAHARLVSLLGAVGRRREAEEVVRSAERILDDLGTERTGALARAWHDVQGQRDKPAAPAPDATPKPDPVRGRPEPAQLEPLIGGRREWSSLRAVLDETVSRRRQKTLLLTGEPGLGKSRIMAQLLTVVRDMGGTVLNGQCFEAEIDRPYGPWIDALRAVPAVAVGDSLGAGLAPILPEFGDDGDLPRSRDRLFGAVSEVIAAKAHSAPPVLVALDDVHWCDESSASLLHYVARMNSHRPVCFALSARGGELPDNQPMRAVIRGLRREGVLVEIALSPLGRAETANLLRAVAYECDVDRIHEESAGNPLFALELARAQSFDPDAVPATLTELVRERVGRLPPSAAEILRWAAVMGPTFGLRRLSELIAEDVDALTTALETLERHDLVRAGRGDGDTLGMYAFAHDVVHRAIYAELSEPRRRLMHLKAARALAAADGGEEAYAADIAYHAARAGESAMAAHACLAAGRRCLSLFASAEADSLARCGLRHARDLLDGERVPLMLDLIDVRFAARRPPPAQARGGGPHHRGSGRARPRHRRHRSCPPGVPLAQLSALGRGGVVRCPAPDPARRDDQPLHRQRAANRGPGRIISLPGHHRAGHGTGGSLVDGSQGPGSAPGRGAFGGSRCGGPAALSPGPDRPGRRKIPSRACAGPAGSRPPSSQSDLSRESK